MKSIMALGLLLPILHAGSSSLPLVQEPPKYQIQEIVQEINPLARVRAAVFDIQMPKYKTSGTASLIGRKNLGDGRYLYRALTAFHVLDKIAKAVQDNKLKANKDITLTLQPKFHDTILQVKLQIEDIDWAVPSNDWGSFTFILEHKLPCITIATKEEFEAIEPFEEVYFIGCEGWYGQQLRKGIISTTHNIAVDPLEQQRQAKNPWHKNPENFFRCSVPVWFGDSGGAIINKEGKLIGILNSFTLWDELGDVVFHSGVNLKTYLILDVVKHNKDFFLVEK